MTKRNNQLMDFLVDVADQFSNDLAVQFMREYRRLEKEEGQAAADEFVSSFKKGLK